MESPSATAHRRLVRWQELLLASSLLIFWSLPTNQDVNVTNVDAREGDDAILLLIGAPSIVIGYSWFVGSSAGIESLVIGSYLAMSRTTMSGPKNNSRHVICHNGSLLFRKTTKEDTGFYTVQVVVRASQFEIETGQLRVFSDLPTPTLKTGKTNPVEDKDVLQLECLPLTPNTTYRFLFNNQTHPMTSSWSNTLRLDPVVRNDSGTYECENGNPLGTHRSNSITLNVLYGPDRPIITPYDSEYNLGDNISLKCSAVSNPPAQISWIVNGKTHENTAEIFVPKITAKDGGPYMCRAHNPATGTNKSRIREIKVISPPSSSLGLIIGIVIGVLVGLAAIAALVYWQFGTQVKGMVASLLSSFLQG